MKCVSQNISRTRGVIQLVKLFCHQFSATGQLGLCSTPLQWRAGVYISVQKLYLFPPPLLKMISRNMSFVDSHHGLFALIISYFVFILPFPSPFLIFLPFSSFFFLFLSPFFLFLLHFLPFSLGLFIFFPPSDIG
jgi:hypothetical protein